MRDMIELIVAVGVAQAVTAQPVPSLPPTKAVEINAENVDLAGAGDLDFEADPAKVPPASTLPPVDEGLPLKLWLNGQGRPLQCDPTAGTYPEVAKAVCTQLMDKAHFTFASGFAQPMSKGFVMIDAHFAPIPKYEPNRPVQFVAPGKGSAIRLSIWPAPDGETPKSRCILMTEDFGLKASIAICDAYLAAETKNRALCSAIAPAPVAGLSMLSCSIAVHAPAPSSRRDIFTNLIPGYRNADIRYPPDTTPPDERLGHKDGRLETSIRPDDYPPVALRYGLEGKVAVLLGIGSDGRIMSCRPLRSSGTALLDNSTCSLMPRRAHFLFAGSPPAYSGLRYAAVALGWVLPRN